VIRLLRRRLVNASVFYTKLADHERIDQAVGRFFQVVSDFGLILDPQYTQIYRKRRWLDSNCPVAVFLDGTLDFISPIHTPRYSFDVATIDLKLTRDREASEFFITGLYHPTPWGSPEKMDFSEAMMYRVIFKLPFVYMVFDYRKEYPGYKDIPIVSDIHDPDPLKAEIARQRMRDLKESLSQVCDLVFRWEKQGWPMIPDALICSGCPIQDCSKRYQVTQV